MTDQHLINRHKVVIPGIGEYFILEKRQVIPVKNKLKDYLLVFLYPLILDLNENQQ